MTANWESPPACAPMIGRLGYGELRIKVGSETRRYYVDGGFVQVAGNLVSVLTNRAVPAASVDARVAAELLTQARSGRQTARSCWPSAIVSRSKRGPSCAWRRTLAKLALESPFNIGLPRDIPRLIVRRTRLS